MKNKMLRHGDRVEKNVAHRPGKGTQRGTIIVRDAKGERSALIGWDNGSEQLCDVRDLRRIS